MEARVFAVTGDMLASIDGFNALSAQERGRISRVCQGYSYRAGDAIVSHHDQERDVYFILAGEIRVTIFAPNGREVTFRDQGQGEMFGELSAIDGEPRSAHVHARTPASLIRINGDNFLTLLNEYPSLNLFTHRRLASLVRNLSVRVYELSAFAVRTRVHAELLRLASDATADRKSAIVRSPPTQQEIASLVGTTREAVARVFKELKDEAIISTDGRTLHVPDMGRLVDLIAGRDPR